MATEALTMGPAHTLVQNTVYALPALKGTIQSTAALETANDTAFTTNGTVAANVPTTVSAMFVRCTVSGGAIVSIKRD